MRNQHHTQLTLLFYFSIEGLTASTFLNISRKLLVIMASEATRLQQNYS